MHHIQRDKQGNARNVRIQAQDRDPASKQGLQGQGGSSFATRLVTALQMDAGGFLLPTHIAGTSSQAGAVETTHAAIQPRRPLRSPLGVAIFTMLRVPGNAPAWYMSFCVGNRSTKGLEGT
ncbi:hypothetical protein I7I51_06549 [Histoplasma capsulatum]|uniref:Uncharacterized protein n=1 Tax=Ajellomyces capsulatus TaxID=5037 RepID=A0A8A1MI50_AJECA|nr:hypothetical protein I7I51_06549 [Histoplasma capsulatum]